MALDVNILVEEFKKLMDSTRPDFAGWPSDPATAATNWTNAYNTYAIAAMDVSNDLLATANPTGFTNVLIPAFSSGIGTLIDSANYFDSAFVAYWTGTIFAVGIIPIGGIGGNGLFSVEISSVVTAVATSVLSNLLQVEFAKMSYDPDTKALELATAFHTATTTAVTVLITGLDTTPPPPAGVGPLPITNTGLIH